MAVSDGQRVNASVTNAAFMSRLVNTSTIGKVDLSNVSTTNLVDLQRIINEILDQSGMANQAATDASAKVYSSNNVVADGDSQKTAIGKLDGEFDTSSGHDHDGVNSKQIDVLDLLNINQIKNSLLVFADDAAFEADKGSPAAIGDIYYNSTLDAIMVHDGVSFNPISGSSAMSREIPAGSINGVNTAFTLGYLPISDQHVSIFLDGVFLEDSEYMISGVNLTLNTAPAFGQTLFAWFFHEGIVTPVLPPTGIDNLEYHTVTVGEEIAKQFTMASTPAVASNTLVDIIDGTPQHFGVDFTITGSTFNWSGYGLDGLLTSGDVVRLKYIS